MASKEIISEEARQENVGATISRTEKFYNENKKTVWSVVIAVLVLGLGALAYSTLVYLPACEEAMEKTFPAELSFQDGNYDLALNGDGNVLGFAQSIENYGAKAGMSVYFYAGVCELQLGNYENAIAYLKQYKGKEPVLAARAIACEGDAYVGLKDYAAAVKCFEKAAGKADNVFAAAYLLKAGLAYEQLGDKAGALEAYRKIREFHPDSIEASDIDRYIAALGE